MCVCVQAYISFTEHKRDTVFSHTTTAHIFNVAEENYKQSLFPK